MPCEDVTEVLKINLDHAERIVGYELNKRTCGRAVGEASLLLPWVEGRRADEVAAADVEAFLNEHPKEDEAEEFLFLKHFFALKLGLAVFLGRESGTLADPCTFASLGYGPDGAEFIAEIKVDLLASQIKACGRCGKGCRTAKAKNPAPATLAQ